MYRFTLGLSILLIFSCNTKYRCINKEEDESKEMYDGAAMIQQFEIERTKDPALGYVPKDRLLAAYKFTELSKLKAASYRTTSGSWIERGPTGDVVGTSNGNTRDGVNPVASGRMRAIWVDLNDASGNTVWVGGVDGGIWKTTNFKTSPATWFPVNDFFTNLSISSICQDPLNKNIMYFCTGEAYGNFDAVRGNGVFRSTDNGVTWNQLAASSTYTNCAKILCDSIGNIYLGTLNFGLLRSTAASGGGAWTAITPTGLSVRVADFEISSTGRLHVSLGLGNTASGGYRYTDIPSTVTSGSAFWLAASTPFPFPSGANCRAELACSGNTLYVLPSNNAANVTTIYKSVNGGDTWSATTTTPPFTGGQAWYCLAADINPSNSNNIIVGSLDCYSTIDGGTSWQQISDWVGPGTTGKYVHADQQIIKWYAANEVLIGTDGGIFYSPDAGLNISNRNLGLNIKQFFSCAYHPTLTDYFLAGAQDNGCHQFTSPGLNTTTEITGGDGGFVHIDQNESMFQYASYVRNRYRRSTDGGSTWSAINFFRSGTVTNPVDFGSFINATEYDNVANILYCGSKASEFFRWSTAQTTPPGNYFLSGGFPVGADTVVVSNLVGTVSAIKVSPYTANRIFLGTGSSKIMRIDNANTFISGSAGIDISSASFPAGATISNIDIGTNDNNIMITFSNYGVNNIWVTTDGGTTWSAIDATLPDMPVRWALFDPLSANTKVWIATETGVWNSSVISGASTTWTASPGFPTVRTDMLKYRSSDKILVAATHGRGLWTLTTTLSVLPLNKFVLKGQWKTNETIDLSWEYVNPNSASFEIESSSNGTYFIKIGTSLYSTTYKDQPSATDVYYRIKGKNIFGNISYSNVIHLQKNSSLLEFTEFKLYPNPVKDEINIGFSASANGKINYQITAANGQLCWRKDENLTARGESLRNWNIQTLRPGTYLFTMMYNNKKISKKFSKL